MHKSGTRYMFTTEGHIVSVDKHLRESPWKELFSEEGGRGPAGKPAHRPKSHDVKVINSSSNVSCFHSSQEVRMWRERTHWQPITGPTRVGLAKSFPRPSRRWRRCECHRSGGTLSLPAAGAGRDGGHGSWQAGVGRGAASGRSSQRQWSGRKEPAEDALDPPPSSQKGKRQRAGACVRIISLAGAGCTGAGGSEGRWKRGSTRPPAVVERRQHRFHTFHEAAPEGQWGSGPTPGGLHCAGWSPSRLWGGTWKQGLCLS